MNYDFLRTYNIPMRPNNESDELPPSSEQNYNMATGYGALVPPPPPPPNLTGCDFQQHSYRYGYYDNNDFTTYPAVSDDRTYNTEYRNRYVAPGRQGNGNYVTHGKPVKRKYNGGSGVIEKVMETSADGTLVIFQGRDISYPNDLNKLIHPLSCEVCQTKMNSMSSAKDHYESKAHDRHLTMWLKRNFTDKGMEAPPVKRFLKQGSTGPEAYYCESCDLNLTSLAHANQHYSGRKHRLVVAKMAKPSGLGYYDSEGKWIRTGGGSKITVKSKKDGRFGIGEEFNGLNASTETSNSSTLAPLSSQQPIVPIEARADHLYCPLCNVNVTSAIQMAMHISGVRHKKKMQKEGMDSIDTTSTTPITTTTPTTNITNPDFGEFSVENSDTMPPEQALLSAVLQADSTTTDQIDVSMYRTPSGQFYCKVCNTSMTNLVSLQQHLAGKRHIKAQMEERAKASLSGAVIKK